MRKLEPIALRPSKDIRVARNANETLQLEH